MKEPVNVLPQRRIVQLELFEVAPDVAVAAKPAQIQAPRLGIMRWTPLEGGVYKPEIETHPAAVNIKDWKEHVYGVSKHVIAALVEAGFVDGERLAPRTLLIHLESYFAHRARMRENPFFWQDSDNRQRYSEARIKVDRQWQDRARNRRQSKNDAENEHPLFGAITQENGQKARRDTAKGQKQAGK